MSKFTTAQTFGTSLDQDDFATTRTVLSDTCTYIIGEETLQGLIAIAKSYEDNMIEGQKKLDKLEWGTCRIEELNTDQFYVHFTDYLTHQSKEHTHRCKQKITVNDECKIVKIEHVSDQEEQERLDAYDRRVGLK